jgi:hypothetical protein
MHGTSILCAIAMLLGVSLKFLVWPDTQSEATMHPVQNLHLLLVESFLQDMKPPFIVGILSTFTYWDPIKHPRLAIQQDFDGQPLSLTFLHKEFCRGLSQMLNLLRCSIYQSL